MHRQVGLRSAYAACFQVYARAKEEVIILLTQSQCVNWFIVDIHKVTMALKELDCELRHRLLKCAQVAAVTLRSWKKSQHIIDIIQTHDICEEVLLVSVEHSDSLTFAFADL
jgi:HD-like signal output (HDOD) protein